MSCNECRKEKFELLDLVSNSKTSCAKCKNIYNILDKGMVIAQQTYSDDIYNFLLENTPVKVGNQVIMANTMKYELTRNDENKIIKDIVQIVRLSGKTIIGKEDKKFALNSILGFLYDDFLNVVKENPTGFLVSFISNLEYNRFIAESLIAWMYKENQVPLMSNDKFINIIIDTLEFIKSFSILDKFQVKGSINLEEIFLIIEGQIANDEHSLELAIEFIYANFGERLTFEDNEVPNVYGYGKALAIIRAINKIRVLKIEITEGIHKSENLEFSIDGHINVRNEKYNNRNFSKVYYDTMLNKRKFIEGNNNSSELNKIVEKYFGINLERLFLFIEELQKNYKIGDEFLIGDTKSWKYMIKELANCSDDAAEIVLSNLILKIDKNELYKDVANKKNRSARKCLIPIDNYLLSPVDLLIYSLMSIHMDIINEDVFNDEFRKEIRKVKEKEDIIFEETVYNEIKKNLKNAKVKMNIGQRSIKVGNKIIILPGQIDILLIYENNIFVIECKNSKLRTSPQSIANEYNKLSKENQKSAQIKLKNKIEVLSNDENKKILIEFMGEEYTKYSDCKITGVITTSNFSIASLDEELLYPVVAWSNLCKWISNKNKSL